MTQDTEQKTATRTKTVIVAGAVLVGVGLLALLANGLASLVSPSSEETVVTVGEAVSVAVEPGSAASTIYQALADAGVVSYGEIERVVDEADAASKLQAGTYDLETGMPASEVLRLLIEGGTAVDSRTITIVEGWTVARIASELAERTEHSDQEYMAVLTDGSVTSPYLPDATADVTALQRWEGLLYPAKYEIPVGSTAVAILQNMADEMVRRFEQVDWASLDELGINRYDALTIGSLIEWEAGTEDDRRLISSVIHNRLDVPMRLQIDATVIYALGSNPGQVLAEHLETRSPHNTYLIDGLPPTPIGTVSEASLFAAVHPADTDYLFYVLASPDGSHAFAVTYEQHQANVRTARASGVLP